MLVLHRFFSSIGHCMATACASGEQRHKVRGKETARRPSTSKCKHIEHVCPPSCGKCVNSANLAPEQNALSQSQLSWRRNSCQRILPFLPGILSGHPAHLGQGSYAPSWCPPGLQNTLETAWILWVTCCCDVLQKVKVKVIRQGKGSTSRVWALLRKPNVLRVQH